MIQNISKDKEIDWLCLAWFDQMNSYSNFKISMTKYASTSLYIKIRASKAIKEWTSTIRIIKMMMRHYAKFTLKNQYYFIFSSRLIILSLVFPLLSNFYFSRFIINLFYNDQVGWTGICWIYELNKIYSKFNACKSSPISVFPTFPSKFYPGYIRYLYLVYRTWEDPFLKSHPN